ncbi:MAG TPA: cupin domain-containing protein, partial [Acetobacteraceae bacterium]|nr:cupin domain-containing protein [Acetobacteraceae bacterium]
QEYDGFVERRAVRCRVRHGAPPSCESRVAIDSALSPFVTYCFTRLPCSAGACRLPLLLCGRKIGPAGDVCHQPQHRQREASMVAVIDLKQEFAGLAMMKNRTPTSSDAERKGSGARLAPYRDGALFSAKFAGTSAWERHPQGDEIVQIVDGATTLHLITEEGRQSLALTAGMIAIVPQNAWHQFEAPEGVCVMTITPQPTEHLRIDVPDPRSAE